MSAAVVHEATIDPDAWCECGDRYAKHLAAHYCTGLRGECQCSGFREVKLGRYQHYKNKTIYRLVGLGRFSEDATMIHAEYEDDRGSRWHRPLRGGGCGFLDVVDLPDGTMVPRFDFLGAQ